MIIVGAKHTGKKLVNAIIRGIEKDGEVSVAALSDRGVQQINFAGQKASNQLKERIKALPEEGQVTIDGVDRVALIVILTKNTEGK